MSKYFIVIFAAAACLLAVSCQPVISKFTMEKMVAIDDEGDPKLYAYQDENRIIEAEEYTFDHQLDQMMSAIQKSGRKKILIYVFGGMNSVDSMVSITDEMARIIYAQSDYYPVFVSWESTLFECYLDHLFMIRRGVKSYAFGPALSPFYLTVDLGRAVTRLPINLVYQSCGTFSSDGDFPELDNDTIKKIDNMKMRVYIGKDNYPGYYSALARTSYIAGLPFRIITTPAIDTCGKSAWDIMKRRSKTAFIKAQPLETSVEKEIKTALSPSDGAMSRLMDRLCGLYRGHPDYEFTVIGHSMGPFIINEMIARYPELPYKNIVYMAPACSVIEAVRAIKPYLEKNPKSTFYNLCIHPHRDTQDMMVYGCLPRGSVLEWIDLYLSDPVSADDLTLGQWDNAVFLMPRLMDSVQSQIVVKAFGLRDPATNTIVLDMPGQHTDFGEPVLRFWEPAFWEIPASASTKNGITKNGIKKGR
ncbi:MAG: alpha/beta hydrolase [Victivallaceae bacterium]|jgi:pimeloyl-ACP methyl ester carboxylesterase